MMRILLILLLFISSTIYAQDCETVRLKAQQLDTERQQLDTGETHFQYGLYLTSLIVSENKCIDKSVLNEFFNAYATAADKGHIRAGARLALINHYGLLAKPIRYKRAYEVSEVMISKMAQKGLDSDFDEYGWMNATILLDLAERMDKNIKTDKYTLAVFKLIENFEPKPKHPDAPRSEDRIRTELNVIKKDAYLNGTYGMEQNTDKALTYAEKLSWGNFYSTYTELLKDGKLNSDLPNDALELFMAMHYIKQIGFSPAARAYAVKKLNKHLNDFKSATEFKEALKNNSEKWMLFNASAFAEYDNNEQMFNDIKTSRFIEDKTGLKGWKFLPKSEKKELFATAISEESDAMESEKRFSIFKAMEINKDASSFYWLGSAYKNGSGVYQDIDKAINYFNNAIKSNKYSNEARLGLAKIYDEEEGYQDWNKAFSLYETLSTSNQFPDAIKAWAEMTYMGLGGATVDKNAAQKAFKRCAELGNKECAENFLVVEMMKEPLQVTKTIDFSISPISRLDKVIDLEHDTMEFTYDVNVSPNNENNTVEIFVYGNSDYPNIFYRNYSPSSGPITTSKTHTAKVFPSYRGYRDFGFMTLSYEFNDNARILDHIPLAVYYLPEK